jgi:hypothetical protein
MEKQIDFSRFTKLVEDDEHQRRLNPYLHVRQQTEIERHPTFFQISQEQEGRSNWSGGAWGGRGGRSE